MARQAVEAWLREEQGSEVIARVQQVSAAESQYRRVPMAGTTRSQPRFGSLDVSIVGKGVAYTEDQNAYDDVVLTARKFGTAVRIAEEDIDDNIADIIQANMIDWASAYGITLDNATIGTTVAANGGTVPYSSIYRTLVNPSTEEQALGYAANDHYLETAGALTYDDLSDLMSLVEAGQFYDGNRSAFMAHPKVKGIIRKIKDADGNPIFTPSPRAGDPDTIFGAPIVWTRGAVTSATATASQVVAATPGVKGTAGNALITFGNVDYLLLGVRSGPESVIIDGRDGASALTDETLLKMRSRRGFAVAHPRAVAVLEITAGV